MQFIIMRENTHGNGYNKEFVKLNLSENFMKFHNASQNIIELEITGNHKKKTVIQYLRETITDGDIIPRQPLLRIVICKQGCKLHYVFRYSVKTTQSDKRYTVEDYEKHLIVDADKEEIVKYVERYFNHLIGTQPEKSVEILRKMVNEWAHPLLLEDVISTLSDDEKNVAAKLLSDHFRKAV